MVEEQVAQGDLRTDDTEQPASKRFKLESAELETKPEVEAKQVDEKQTKHEVSPEASQKENAKTQIESEQTTQVDGELKSKIAKQIEYYFSDVNLMRDKFMLEQLKKNDNAVSLSVLLTFSRLAQLTKSEDVIIEALKDYDSSYMKLNAEKKLVCRTQPIPDREQFLKELDTRTVHISDFPDSVKFDELHRFCSRFGEVESLSMRNHYKTRQFKGCIHVVFKSEADAKKVAEEKLTFKDRELRSESMEEYHKRKEDIKRSRLERRKDRKSKD